MTEITGQLPDFFAAIERVGNQIGGALKGLQRRMREVVESFNRLQTETRGFYLVLQARQYAVDRNPVHAWEAYLLHRRSGEPVPEWVLQYLDRAAENLSALDWRAQLGRKKITKPAAAIAEALEMKQPGRHKRVHVFAKRRTFEAVWLGAEVLYRMRRGDQQTYAIDYVAKARGVPKTKVHRAWKRVESLMPSCSFNKSATS
jgi:hypothetical protein